MQIVTWRSAPILLAALLAIPTAVRAQTPPPPAKQEGTAEMAFVGTTGNTSTSTFSAGGEHIVRPPKWLIKNRVILITSSSDGVSTANSFLYSFRTEREINARLSGFGEYGYFQDKLSGVSHRNSVAGGLTFKIATGPKNIFSVDAGLGYLNEQRVAGANVSSATYLAGAVYKLKLSETAELSEEARLLGTFAIADDWRGSNIISVTAKLTSIFALKVSNVVRYVNAPPPGFKTTDTTTSVALVASFKRQ